MLPMFLPMRIDHHGWQLAMLSLTVAGLADDARRRGGLLVGLASAASLTIGLEMLPYCAMAGAILALRSPARPRSEEHTSELQSLMRTSYAVLCLKKKKKQSELSP